MLWVLLMNVINVWKIFFWPKILFRHTICFQLWLYVVIVLCDTRLFMKDIIRLLEILLKLYYIKR
jgi:hypothetical protein